MNELSLDELAGLLSQHCVDRGGQKDLYDDARRVLAEAYRRGWVAAIRQLETTAPKADE